MDSFAIYPYNHLYKINVKAGTKVLITPYSITMNLENEQLPIKQNLEDGKLLVYTINTFPREYRKQL